MKTLRHNTMSISLALIIVVVILMPLQAVWAADTFTMAFLESPDKDPLWRYAELVWTEVFRRLGLEFAYAVYPVKRCGVAANAGEADGEPSRIAAYNQAFPNLIRVEEPVHVVKASAFATDPSISLDGWDSLKGTLYTVEYVIGIKTAEVHLAQVVEPERLSVIPTIEQGLKKLRVGRTDVFIHVEDMVMTVLQTEEFHDSGIRLAGVMEEVPLYPFVHKKHEALAPELAEVLRQMKAEGLLEKYLAQATEEFEAAK